MPPTFEKYVFQTVRKNISAVGKIEVETIDPTQVVATRPFLTEERLTRTRRRANPKYPQAIEAGGKIYAIDGHHTLRIHIDNKVPVIASILKTNNHRLQEELEKNNHGLVSDLEII